MGFEFRGEILRDSVREGESREREGETLEENERKWFSTHTPPLYTHTLTNYSCTSNFQILAH